MPESMLIRSARDESPVCLGHPDVDDYLRFVAGRRVDDGAVIRCRLDSAFYNHCMVAAIGKAGAQFSITARTKAIR